MSDIRDVLFTPRILRFAIVGGLSSCLYTLVVALLLSFDLTVAAVASAIGYAASVPANFFGQKFFAFQSKAPAITEVGPFLLVHIANFSVSAGIMWMVVTYLGLHYLYGIVLVVLTIPVATYVLLNLVVFRIGVDGGPDKV